MSVVESIIKQAKKDLKAQTFDEVDYFDDAKLWISSGVPEIDLLLNTYGYPSGIMEVSGKSRSGKTTLSLHFIKEVLRNGGMPVLISTERRDNKKYAQEIGIDPKKVLIHKSINMEDGFDKIEKSVEMIRGFDSEIPIGIVWDSLGGTPTKAELEGDADDKFMATAAKVIKQNLRRLTQLFSEEKVVFFIVNQLYNKIGVMFGKKTESYGGDAIKYHSQLRFELINIKTLSMQEGREKSNIGQITKFDLQKTDFGMPFQSIDLEMLWGYGFCPSKDLLQFAFDKDVLTQKGANGFALTKLSKYYWKKQNDFYELYIADPTFRNIIRVLLSKMVREEVKSKRGLLS